MMKVTVDATEKQARALTLVCDRGEIETPIFMPVGTRGSVRSQTMSDLKGHGAQIILGNTYHLLLQPGLEVIKKAGSLHQFINWDKPILTDSGGFQVFSLKEMAKVTEQGVSFRTPKGEKVLLTPEYSMDIQRTLDSDIAMIFDQCLEYPATFDQAKVSMELSLRWAERSYQAFSGSPRNLFAIVQGGMYEELREKSLAHLKTMDFQGFALGGLSVGEPKEEMKKIVSSIAPKLPSCKPRYLMGVGKPRDLVFAIKNGIDMFDCVLPTRNARNAYLYTWQGLVRLRNSRYRQDFTPLSENCQCYTCRHHTKAYLYHLDKCKELSGYYLNTLHNLHFYLDLVRTCRSHILKGTFEEFSNHFLEHYKD